jgi:hypothetical protein
MATWYESKSDSAKIQERYKKQKEEKQKAESRYPGRRIGYKNGVLIFLDTGKKIPGSSFITEPDEDGVASGWFY